MGVEPKIGGWKTPKMDGENNGKPYEQMDDLGVALFWGWHPYRSGQISSRPHTGLDFPQLG